MREHLREVRGLHGAYDFRDERELVIQTLQDLDAECELCGGDPTDMSGTNQFKLRFKCGDCSEVMLSYPVGDRYGS